MQRTLRAVLVVAGFVFATHAAAQITFYEGEGFRGRAFTADKPVWNFERLGFNESRLVGSCRSRALGGVRARALRRSLRRPAPGQLRLAGKNGYGQPHFLGAPSQQECTL